MWFKNIQVYQLTESYTEILKNLKETLQKKRYMPCGKHTPSSFGWNPPLGHNNSPDLLFDAPGYTVLNARKEEKILPSSVIKDMVEERVQELESQGQTIFRKQKEAIKDEIIQTLLPQAFSRKKDTFGYFAEKEKWLIIDTSSQSQADQWVELLQKTMGTLPLNNLQVKSSPASVLTDWVLDTAPKDIEIGNECELHATKEEGIIRCSKQDLFSSEVLNHIKSGKQVVKLAITWDNKISCVIDQDLTIKKIKFIDIKSEEAKEDTDDIAITFAADLAVMSYELGQFINRIIELFGGAEKTQAIEAQPTQEENTQQKEETPELAEA